MQTRREKERVGRIESVFTLPRVEQIAAEQHRELSSVLCDDLEGWDGGRLKREGVDV